MITRRRLFVLSSASVLVPHFVGSAAHAQRSPDWPNRVVRVIVPVAAGGPTDTVARVLAEQLSKIWGHQVVVENKGGAGTNLANEMVARSDPDGYTVLYATASLAVNRSLYRSLSYDALSDLAPVSLVSRFPFFMFVPNSSPAKSVMEFIAHAKAHPGKVTLASPGTGSAPHLAGELFRQMAKIDACALSQLVEPRGSWREKATTPGIFLAPSSWSVAIVSRSAETHERPFMCFLETS